MGSLTTYSPNQISVIIDDLPVTGFADGEGIKVERNADSFTYVKGMSGEGARVKTVDNSGKVTLTLMQTSPANQYLSNIYLEDEFTGAKVFNLLIRDQNGTSLHEASTAWIVKPADAMYSKDLTNREWVIMCDSLSHNIGGSNITI